MLSNLGLSILIVIALINGINIVCNRVLNAKLGMHIGHLRSSYWNHLVGAIFLIPFLWMGSKWSNYVQDLNRIPVQFYLGGLVGVIFVWMINWVVPRLGALKSMLILLTSQMVFGLLFDIFLGKIQSIPMSVLGIAIILLGAFLGKISKTKIVPSKEKESSKN